MEHVWILIVGFALWRIYKENKPDTFESIIEEEHSELENYLLNNQRTGIELVNWRKTKEEYLHSKIWFSKRQERMKIDNYKCQICKYHNQIETSELNVHHLCYERLGNEDLVLDLVTLCKTHHTAVHDYIGYYTDDKHHTIPYDKIK